ncbi:MAG: serine hydrolase [Cyclobacteriaceae bacterium]|nr:serine hydrolase [Cyclobacteriaceae bacterium]
MIRIFFTLATLLLASQLHAQSLTTFLDDCANHGFRGSVLMAAKGNMVVHKGYGLADAEAGRAQTAETVFSVGSITKQFTAAGIMKLVDQKKISVSDKLSKFFPEAPEDKKNITIHQLLTHSSGFDGALGDDYDNINAQAFMKLAFASPLNGVPGEQYDYSNVGYSVLGIIIEKVSGVGYEKFLQQYLFKPAGMKRTGYLVPAFQKEELAVGYRNGTRWGTAMDHPWLNDGPGWHLRANGGMLSTVGDMYKWYKALQANTILSKSVTQQMFSKQMAEDPEGTTHYGYGWVVQNFSDTEFIWHNGGNGVYNAFMALAPAEDLCIIASSNTNKIISDKIAMQLLRIYRGQAPGELPGSIERSEPPYRTSPVTRSIYNHIAEKGGAYFEQHYEVVLKEAGFDFENDMILFGAGELLLEANNVNDAVHLFTVYTKLFPRIVVAWNQLGRAYLQLNHKEKAKACFEQSLSIRPANNPALELLKGLEK